MFSYFVGCLRSHLKLSNESCRIQMWNNRPHLMIKDELQSDESDQNNENALNTSNSSKTTSDKQFDYQTAISKHGSLLTTSEIQHAFALLGDEEKAKYRCTLLL